MKGITPIISIIILLLITIGLASAAWTYMSGYMSSMMARQLEIFPPDCIGGRQAAFIARNIGTGNVAIGDVYAIDTQSGSPQTIAWFTLAGAAIPAGSTITPGTSVMGKLSGPGGANCTNIGFSKTCAYTITISGSNFKQESTVSCTG